MNELVKTDRKPQITTGKSVSGLIPQTIEEAFRVAQAVSVAKMAPYGMETPEQCLIAIMSGAEVGIPPMQAVQNIAVINNRPCIWGDGLIGVVRASGFCLYIKEWIEGEGDEMVAYCETHRKGEANPVKESFSVADAKKAGLWQTEEKVTRRAKGGGTYEKENDSPWYRHPKRMLKMRARAFCLRDVYADVLKGLQVREEVEDYEVHRGPDRAKDVTPSANAQKFLNANDKTMGDINAANVTGFKAGHVDAEIESLNSGDASGQSPAQGEGDASPTADPSPDLDALRVVKSSLFAIFDLDDYEAAEDPVQWALEQSKEVVGSLQGGALKNADQPTHQAANGILKTFEAVVHGKRTIDQAEEWFKEMWGEE